MRAERSRVENTMTIVAGRVFKNMHTFIKKKKKQQIIDYTIFIRFFNKRHLFNSHSIIRTY